MVSFCSANSFDVTLFGAETELLLKDSIDPIEIIEFSSDLDNWIPVARNYNNQWETIYPHAYALSAVAGSTDQMMVLPTGEEGYYRKRSASTINTVSNKELASRFLMQATFGPSRSKINSFPNVNSNTFGSPGDDSFENWIDAQIAISPFYHRAHWRERSDPDYQDLSNQTTLVLQSGGTGTFMVGDIISQTEGNTVGIGEISSINQNNNVLESISVTKRALEPFTVSFGAINLYNYDNTSSITYRDLLYDNTDSPTSWSIEMGTLSSPATVTVEFLPTPSQYSSGTFSLFNSIQTDIWDASVDVLGQTATFKQVAQVSGVQSGTTISGSIDTTRSDNYIDVAAMRITIDYNPGQLRYNIDFGVSDFDSDDNDAASGFGTNYYIWNTTSTSASFNPFSAADPTFGDYASIITPNFSVTTNSGASNIDTNRDDGTSASYSISSIINYYLANEVGHNPAYGQQFSFSRGQTVYHTDWRNPLPGYGGLFDINGNVIDENHPDWPTNPNWIDYAGRPMIGLHAENCEAHLAQNPGTGLSRYDVNYGVNETKRIVWNKAAIDAPDQLRQRVAWALSQYFVVAELGNNQPQAVERWLNYYDIFTRHAFGNFSDILEEVTWSPHMGYYLSHMENRKANISQGTYPDENYAREVMQLFTIGLWELNEDGTQKLDANGDAIPTYDNDDIFEFAKVFTGMRRPLSRGPNTNIEELSNNYIDPMRVTANWHDFSAKTLLDGTTLGPFNQNENGVRDDVAGLLDHLFNHSNMPPFFARFMIQRFTVSNPSPAYIQAVAQAFKTGFYNGSGSGDRGCMEATIKAVLLHPEARSASLAYDPMYGKLREPLIRLIHVARAFELTSLRTYGWFYFKNLHDTILQAPHASPSVFNFYRPDYAPNGVIADAALNAPEFQIHNDVSALQLSNGLITLLVHGIAGGDIGNIGQRNNIDSVLDFTYEDSISGNTSTLIDHLDLVLCAGRLTSENRASIMTAANTPSLNLTGIDKVKYIAGLIVLTPEFNTLY